MSVVSDELRARAIADLEDLAHAIDGPVMVWSNEVFVLTAAANDAVRFYRSRGDVILGLEGFNTDGRHLIPRMDCISDFSSIDRTRPDAADQSADAAISVLRKWASPPQFVTFVIQRAGEDA